MTSMSVRAVTAPTNRSSSTTGNTVTSCSEREQHGLLTISGGVDGGEAGPGDISHGCGRVTGVHPGELDDAHEARPSTTKALLMSASGSKTIVPKTS